VTEWGVRPAETRLVRQPIVIVVGLTGIIASSGFAARRHRMHFYRADRRLRARLYHGPLSHQVIALAITGRRGMTAPGLIWQTVQVPR
jgi:hypothetical protein